MATELAKMHKPSDVEPQILQRWQDANAFHAEPTAVGDPYCIVIPPPNVTAALHLGHALNNTLQDILIRWRRMAGDNAVWIPGTDHAGIATQTVVEKRVLAEEGKRRTDFKREEFVAKVQAWKDEYEATITNQLKTMGCSCDWQRQRFTMDPICARAVREAFFRLFKDGLIYRGKRLVNWDPATQTALADDEVEMEEIDGQFYYLEYPLADGSGHITVATTRPETMLGDTAVAVNPKDPRAAGLRGKQVRLPIVNRVVPIIEDDYVVLADPESQEAKARYASGFLKVTPGHDENDYLLGQRHKLPIINVLAPDGTISKDHGWPAEEWIASFGNEAEFLLGMDRFEAREAVVEWFRKEKLLDGVKPYRHSVGHSYRSHVPIEPYLSDQWYVKVTDPRLAGAALKALAKPGDGLSAAPMGTGGAPWQGQLRIFPERYAKTYQAWHENIRDWCISRQLWWGHRIPIWTRDLELPTDVAPVPCPERGPNAQACAALDRAIGGRWSEKVRGGGEYFLRIDTHPEKHGWVRTYVSIREPGAGIQQIIKKAGWQQDPDVLDTWFSSALWPISTLGWPEETPELKRWNPSHTLSTAREILTLWVSRMVMFNLYFRGCLPFEEVFIHAMIQDGEGRKMSKSLGNGVDPLDIIHSHGSDAMRFTLAKMTTNTQDVRLPVVKDPATGKNSSDKFDEGRNFANKLWNAVRFALGNLEAESEISDLKSQISEPLTLADRWVLSRLARLVWQTDEALRGYEFSVYAQGLYDFIWRDLCDWYIEAVKPTVKSSPVQRQVLAMCLDVTLRLLHPVMPFITEKLWEHLNEVMPQRGLDGVHAPPSKLLIRAAWPTIDPKYSDTAAEEDFELIHAIVTAIREVRTTYKVPPRQKVTCSAKAPAPIATRLLPYRTLAETLANFEGGEIGPHVVKPADAAATVVAGVEIFIHGLIEAGAERGRITKRLDELTKSIATLHGRLNNKAYAEKAPPHLVQQTRAQLTAAAQEAEMLRKQLASLK